MYIDDVFVSGTIFAALIRSPVAKGRLTGVKPPPKMPSTYTLISAADIPGKNQLSEMDIPIFASDKVSYLGEPVALLAGPDIAKLEEYAKLCTVNIEPQEDENENEIFLKREFAAGNTDRIFASAASVVSGTYRTGIQEHWYSEAHGALARFSGNKLTVHTPSQWIYHVRRSAAGMLKMDEAKIQIEQTQIGVHLDGKLFFPSLISCQAALAAYVTKKPVKLMLIREDDFRYSPKRNQSTIDIRSALGEKGDVLGTEISIKANLGAYGIFTDEIIDHTILGSLGMYKLGKVNLTAEAIKDNIPPQGPLGGFGLSQGTFAVERHVSRIAESLQLDPAEWRKRHSFRKGDGLAIGIALKEQAPVADLINKAAGMGDYYRKWASYELLRRNRRNSPWSFTAEALRGIGIASAYQGSGFLHSGADKGIYSIEITQEKENSILIKTSIPLFSAEEMKVWKDLASEILGIDQATIKIICTGVDSGPISLSRKITVLFRLFEKCCDTLRKKRLHNPLPLSVKCNIKPEKVKAWGIEGTSVNANAFERPGMAAAIVETEIDPITFLPFIRGIWLAIDGGKILDGEGAKRAVKTGVIHALGWASREQVGYIDGHIPGSVIHNYDIPTPEEIPPIHIEFTAGSDKKNPPTPKGIGDLAFSCIPAAYVQAVSQAMDHVYEKIPISAKDIWEAGLEKTKHADKNENTPDIPDIAPIGEEKE